MDNLFYSSHPEVQLPALTHPLPPPILETAPDEGNDDVYRGLVGLRPLEPTTPRVEDYFSHPHFAVPSEHSSSRSSSPSSSSTASSSSSTSSSSTGHGRALGALAALVERAISRWARGTSDSGSSTSSSSASTSSSTSSSSSHARSRSRSFSARRPRRRRRGASTTSINSIQREYAPSRIAQARQLFEYSRRLPKEFTLLLPPPSIFSDPGPAAQIEPSDSRIVKTTSSKVILAHLETLLHRPPRGRAPRRPRGDKDRGARSSRIADLAGTCQTHTSTPSPGPEKGKGKIRLGTVQSLSDPAPTPGSQRPKPHRNNSGDTSNRTWWLDVASPSWEDMRALGKLLHLHPLTLEDIVQREQREKLEVFPGLGYYFVVFRAIEPYRHPSSGEDEIHHRSGGSDPVIAVTVYLVVLPEGICSFHFEDISEHTDRVRNRILQLEKTVPWTPDWIAHGLLDSIVDGFFPIIQNIEKEVEELDGLVSGIDNLELSDLDLPATVLAQRLAETKPALSPTSNTTVKGTGDGEEKGEKEEMDRRQSSARKFGNAISSCIPRVRSTNNLSTVDFDNEKLHLEDFPKPRLSTASHPLLDRLGRIFLPDSLRPTSRAMARSSRSSRSSVTSVSVRPKPSVRYNLLLRIAACRRLVTTLTRLLTPKNEVVTQIRKRLMLGGGLAGTGVGNGSWAGQGISGVELNIYWGDVQDHIVTMHHSLDHYERILSHSHPAYLSHLRWSLSNGKGGIDRAILTLTSVTITCFTIQLSVGLMSMNVHIPRNRRPGDVPGDEDLPPSPFYAFGAVLSFVCLVAIGVVFLIRYWWRKAKRKYRRSADI